MRSTDVVEQELNPPERQIFAARQLERELKDKRREMLCTLFAVENSSVVIWRHLATFSNDREAESARALIQKVDFDGLLKVETLPVEDAEARSAFLGMVIRKIRDLLA